MFDLGETSEPTFEVTLVAARPGKRVVNQASLEWTSLHGDNVDTAYALSPYNALIVEPRLDPMTPVDLYQVVASISVIAPAIPETGFAPGVGSALPARPEAHPGTPLGDMKLEIPALDLRSPIVGVGTDAAGWT